MPKRGINIYKRKDGRWEARYIKEYINNKAKYGYIYGKTYSITKEKLLNVKNQKEENILHENNKKSFYTISTEWLNSSKIKVKQSTYVKYHTIIEKYIKDYIGNILIDNITSKTITDYTESLTEFNLSNSTIRDILCIISMILKYYRIVYDKPMNIIVNYPKCTKKDIDILAENEIKSLEKYLINNINLKKLGLILTLYTGLRVGEICALKWEDINLNIGYITVRRTMQRLKNLNSDGNNKTTKTMIIEDTPKSKTSVRDIPLPDFLIDILKIFKCENPDYYLLTGNYSHIEPRVYQNYFKKCLKNCDIEDINFHALRHTFATRCNNKNFDTKSLSEILGHSSVKITLDIYTHPSFEHKKKNMNKLNLLTIYKPSTVKHQNHEPYIYQGKS
jgi:Site-specific recombinase XerD